jgi:hypothetical protein
MEMSERYHIWRWRLVALWIVMFTLVVAYSVHANRVLSSQTHAALCTFHDDLRGRYENGVKFLKEHPNGIPGIDAGVIRQSLKGQIATLRSLEQLDC